MTEASELRAAVRAVGAFRDLSEENLSRLIAATRRLTFEAGEALITQGEPSEHADLVLEGEIVVTFESVHGAIPMSRLSAPCLVGEMGALAQFDRTASVRALSRVKALRVEQSALLEAALASPTLLIDVIGRMGERLRRVNGAMSLYTHALAALERQEFGPEFLAELRNPLPDLADFGETFNRMAEQILLRRQRDDEMAAAAIIQRALLPDVRDFAETCGVDVCAAMTPARDVGGDFFDLVRLEDGRIALGVGDVCGKGAPAALFMGITKTLIRINLRERPDLSAAILKANAYLTSNYPADHFATLVYAAFDPMSGEVEYVSCGHPPALLRRADGTVESLLAGGLPVGMFEGLKVNVRRAHLRPGDVLLLYTDGVTEAVDREAREFGDKRLIDLLSAEKCACATDWTGCVNAAVRAFADGQPQFDDVTCLAVAHA
jgi:sigma-B regulation protein RsbU (phosphoserine phosphatase)